MVLSIRSVCTIGLSSSHSPVTQRYGTRIFSAWPSQVSVLRKASNFASSVKPAMYMKRFL